MGEFVGGATVDQCSLLTVVGEAVEDVECIGPAIARLRQQLRRVIEKGRGGDSRWNTVSVKGWVEVDAISLDLLEIIGPRRQSQLSNLGIKIGDKPVWIVTLHSVVRHDDLAANEVRAALMDRWPSDDRADVQPFYQERDALESASHIVRYALKNACEINVDDHAQVWPIDWQVTYFEWLSAWSASFKRLSISVRARRKSSPDKYCHHSITGDKMMMVMNERADFLGKIKEALPEREKFVVAATVKMLVSFDSTPSRLGYLAAREWCVAECEGGWAYSAKRSERDRAGASPAFFDFEMASDAERFGAEAACGAFAPRLRH